MKIRGKLFLLLLAIALLPLTVLGAVSYYLSRDAVEAQVRAQLARGADDLRGEIEERVDFVHGLADAIGEDHSFRVYARHVGRQDVAILRDVLEQVIRFHLDRDERLLGVIATFRNGERFVVLKPGMSELALAERSPVSFVGDNLFCLAREVGTETEAAVVHVYVRPALLTDAFAKVDLGETAAMTGFFALGDRTFAARPGAVPATYASAFHPTFPELPGVAPEALKWIRGGERVAMVGRVGTLPVVAGAAMPAEAYLAPVGRVRTVAFLVALATVLGVGFAAMAFASGIVRPVAALVRLTHTFAGGDLSARVPAGRADELGELARDFNAMAGTIQESQARIAERTRALEEERARVQLAINMCRNVLAEHGFEAQARAVCEEIRAHVKAERVAVFLVDHDARRVEGVASSGGHAAWVRGQAFPLAEADGPGLAAAVARCAVHGRTESGSIAAGTSAGGREASRRDASESARAFACVPLRGHGRTIGVVAMVAGGVELDGGMLATVEAFAHLVALAILEARTAAEAREAYIEVLSALAGVIEKRDAYTGMHTENVLAYSTALARAVGLSEEDLEGIRIGAILHDIGKVAMADASLRKAGQLTEEEFEEIKRHPMVGYEILSGARFLKAAREIVRHHHERWDGSGYPDGLKGTAIPIAAQIVAVADAYDAMTTDRPYRKGLSGAEAIARLKSASGTQFNPYLVTLFLETLGLEENGSSFRVEAEKAGAALSVRVFGCLTLEAGREVLSRAVEWLKGDGKGLVIDLTGLERLTDGGIWLLLRLSWRCRAAGGVLVLVARGAIRDQVVALAADFPFRIVEDPEEARRAATN